MMTSEGRKRKAAYDTSMGRPQWEAWGVLSTLATRAGRGRQGAEPPTRNP